MPKGRQEARDEHQHEKQKGEKVEAELGRRGVDGKQASVKTKTKNRDML